MENSQKTFRRAQNVTDQRRSVADYLIPVTSSVRPAAAINATDGWRHRTGYRRSYTGHTFAHHGVQARPRCAVADIALRLLCGAKADPGPCKVAEIALIGAGNGIFIAVFHSNNVLAAREFHRFYKGRIHKY
jgi:hypothetical protein